MAYTQEQIIKISANRGAVENRIYVDNDGNRYKGNSQGRLDKVYTSDKSVSVKPNINSAYEDLNTYLNNLRTETDTIESDIVDINTDITNINTDIDTINSRLDVIESEALRKEDFNQVFLLMGG